MKETPPSKIICLFADGTGNAFLTQESNVWRLYDALDKSQIGQISYYVPGVGTSGFKPWAIVDAATGLGVPSNVRRLYEFLCWNYNEGDKIYAFGFSRGSFTIRALIGMITAGGLLPRGDGSRTFTTQEMRRFIRDVWRLYRRPKGQPWYVEAPTVKISRALRDLVLGLKRLICCQKTFASYKLQQINLEIEFIGLFDTVAAYGVPVEEMRDAINWAIWPIKFHDQKLSKLVLCARHALSIDDERQTFHPIRFDKTLEQGNPRIKEVWFSGAHSDIGGGYPDGALSLVPLWWMLNEIGGGLSFRDGMADEIYAAMSSLAPTHDPRSGLGVFYRYAPRVIENVPQFDGAPIIHHSVVEKIAFGDDRYAPHSLPADIKVLLPDGDLVDAKGFQPKQVAQYSRLSITRADLAQDVPQEVAKMAIRAIGKPEPGLVDLVNKGIWLRRKAYFTFLACCLVAASLPWTSGLIAERASGAKIGELGEVERINGAGVAILQEFAGSVGGLLPAYLKPWVDAIVAQPLISVAVLLLAGVALFCNGWLRDWIADNARYAWFSYRDRTSPYTNHLMQVLLKVTPKRQLTTRKGIGFGLGFALTLLLFCGGFLFLANRVVLNIASGFGTLCMMEAKQQPRTPRPGQPEIATGFKTSNPCWDTGLFVEQGFTYELTLEMTEPYLDGPEIVDIAGFTDTLLRHLIAAPLKRWLSEAYFQPIGRIGRYGRVEWPIESIDGLQPLELNAAANLNSEPLNKCSPSQASSNVSAAQQRLGIRTQLRSRFTAEKTDELFLYVNDAMFGSDLLAWLEFTPAHDCFYTNNSGAAKLTLTRLPLTAQ